MAKRGAGCRLKKGTGVKMSDGDKKETLLEALSKYTN
jgi:hypothetical protein